MYTTHPHFTICGFLLNALKNTTPAEAKPEDRHWLRSMTASLSKTSNSVMWFMIFMDINGYSWILNGYSWYTGVISRTKPENSTFFNIWGHFWALYCIEKWVLSPKLTGKLKVHLAVSLVLHLNSLDGAAGSRGPLVFGSTTNLLLVYDFPFLWRDSRLCCYRYHLHFTVGSHKIACYINNRPIVTHDSIDCWLMLIVPTRI